MSFKVNEVLKSYFLERKVRLVDFKLSSAV